tara:strand:+ start:682 stop:1023 length:342 start_codon:yes stop_codon:yes gene_type:complete
MRFEALKKFIFICFLSFFNQLAINSTPNLNESEEVYEDKIEKIAEIIYENHNIDIENRSLNYGYYGYKVEYEDDCKVTLSLMDYSKKERFFNVDSCNNKSHFFKIINHKVLPN